MTTSRAPANRSALRTYRTALLGCATGAAGTVTAGGASCRRPPLSSFPPVCPDIGFSRPLLTVPHAAHPPGHAKAAWPWGILTVGPLALLCNCKSFAFHFGVLPLARPLPRIALALALRRRGVARIGDSTQGQSGERSHWPLVL